MLWPQPMGSVFEIAARPDGRAAVGFSAPLQAFALFFIDKIRLGKYKKTFQRGAVNSGGRVSAF
jgi:hypothetical protein